MSNINTAQIKKKVNMFDQDDTRVFMCKSKTKMTHQFLQQIFKMKETRNFIVKRYLGNDETKQICSG